MFATNFVSFLSFKCLCAFSNQKTFEANRLAGWFRGAGFGCLSCVYSPSLCAGDSLSVSRGLPSSTCLHLRPRLGSCLIIQISSSVQWSLLQPSRQREVSWGASLPHCLCAPLVYNFPEALACWQQFSTASSHKGWLSTAHSTSSRLHPAQEGGFSLLSPAGATLPLPLPASHPGGPCRPMPLV